MSAPQAQPPSPEVHRPPRELLHWFLESALVFVFPKVAIKAGVVIMAAFIAAAPICVTQIRDYDLVVLRRWEKRVDGEIEAGLKWYWPFINTIHRYDTRPRMIYIKEQDNDDHV